MFGPVFFLEWLNACRRGRHHLFRLIYVAVLLAEFAFFLLSWSFRVLFPQDYGPLRQTTVELAWGYFTFFTVQHLLLILLLAPALAAGSITDEKSRGTLTLVLTTDLTSAEILVGKWLGQLSQVLVLSIPVAPLLVFLQFVGGLEVWTVPAWLLELLCLAMALAAASLLVSVWVRKTTTAVLMVYIALAGALMAAWLTGAWEWDLLSFRQPHYQVAGGHLGIQAWLWLPAIGLGCSLSCLALATWRLRPVFERQWVGESAKKREFLWLQRPAVSDLPLRWKERFVGELGFLSLWRWLPRSQVLALVALVSLGLAMMLEEGPESYLILGLGFMLVATGLVGVRSSGVISGERERQTWESLLLTPLEPRQLLRGKLWGIVDSAKPYMLAYLLPTLLWSLRGSWWGVFCTIYCWLAAWGLLYFQGANGIHWSARSVSSWQSLLKTSTSGFWAIFLGFFLTGVIAFNVFSIVSIFFPGMFVTAWEFLLALWLALFLTPAVAYLFARAEILLEQAENCVAEGERVPQGTRSKPIRRRVLDPAG